MSTKFYVRKLVKDESSTQKCYLPAYALENSPMKIGDFISINCNTVHYICRVFPSLDPEKFIAIDDTVSSFIYGIASYSNAKEAPTISIFDDLSMVKVNVCKKVRVKVIILNTCLFSNMGCDYYKAIISKLIQNYVVKNKVIIKCKSQVLADLFQIDSVVIEDVFVEGHVSSLDDVYGRIMRTTIVEVSGIHSVGQLQLIMQYKTLKLGRIKDGLELLKIEMGLFKSILVLGPSGCGKSTLIKKFCSSLDCFLLLLDGYKTLSLDACNFYVTQLINSSKIFPSVLIIDNIDKIFSDSLKFLIAIIQSLEMHNVLIIAVAENKDLLKPSVVSMFKSELFLDVPSLEQRKEIFDDLKKHLDFNLDSNCIAEMTPGSIASDLKSLMLDLYRRKISKHELHEELTKKDIDGALQSVIPSLLKTSKWRLKVKPIHWEDIGGMKRIKERLQMLIEKPLLHPEFFQKVGLSTPRGILLFGPPGCCKTTIARGLATECKANFFAANPSQIYSPYVGESEKNISELFYEARLCAPSIIFLDEVDSLVGRRELKTKTIGVAEKILTVLLTEMDGFGVSSIYSGSENHQKCMSYSEDDKNENMNEQISDRVIVVAATNRPDLIDDALLRPGRFDIMLYVPPPDAEERESILRTCTEDVPLYNVDLKKIAEETENFSGADLKHLYAAAAQNALKEKKDPEFISGEDFVQALKDIRPSICQEQINMYEKLASRYGNMFPDNAQCLN